MSEWISVNDSLPENYAPIIFTAYDSELGRVITRYGYKGENSYVAFESEGELFFKSITHWMPLPEPPGATS